MQGEKYQSGKDDLLLLLVALSLLTGFLLVKLLCRQSLLQPYRSSTAASAR
jgi:hypothetical protein